MQQQSEAVSCTEKVKLRVPGQKYVVVNLIGPGLRLVSKQCAFRVLGCFASEAEAKAHADEYRAKDARFDIYVCAMYEFLPFPDEVHDVGDVVYHQEDVNKLLESHNQARTTTEAWTERVEASKASGGEDKWGMGGL